LAQAMFDAEHDAIELAEAELYKRARKKDTTALIFYLKTHKSQVYGDKRGP
jgi:hypothetical protein